MNNGITSLLKRQSIWRIISLEQGMNYLPLPENQIASHALTVIELVCGEVTIKCGIDNVLLLLGNN
jgi:hypothetical protein